MRMRDVGIESAQGSAAETGMTMTRRAWLATGTAFLASACARAATTAEEGSQGDVGFSSGAGTESGATGFGASLDAEIPRLMRLASVPGLSLAIVRRDGATLRGYGVRRATDAAPATAGAASAPPASGSNAVTADTAFEAASLTKPVFAYLVLRLAADGVLDLDRPLGAYHPLPDAKDERAKTITARHVLSHSGGWRNWRAARDTTLTSEFAPGARFSYSGEGYFFLQRVVERVTGRGVLALVRERVLQPLGMRGSSFIWTPAIDPVLATPHTNRGQPMQSHGARIGRGFHELTDAGRPVAEWTTEDAERALRRVDPGLPVQPNFLVPNVAASMVTTARDYAAFVAHLLGVPGAPAGGRGVLDRMMAPQVTINEALRWGLGVGLESHAGRQFIWHWGDNPGFKNFIIAEPATGSAVIVFANGNNGMRVYERVVRAITGTDHPAFLWI